jgi:hypothetical protein
VGSYSDGGGTSWSNLGIATDGYIFGRPTLHKTFTWIPKKTVDETWTWGNCYAFYKHYRNGSDLYYVSNEDAFAGVMTEKYRMKD